MKNEGEKFLRTMYYLWQCASPTASSATVNPEWKIYSHSPLGNYTQLVFNVYSGEGIEVGAVFFDFTKTFNSVTH